MINRALNSLKQQTYSAELERAKTRLEELFESFKKSPTTHNGGELYRAMEAYGAEFAKTERGRC